MRSENSSSIRLGIWWILGPSRRKSRYVHKTFVRQVQITKRFAQWMEYIYNAMYVETRPSTQQGKRHLFFNCVLLVMSPLSVFWENFRIQRVAKVAEQEIQICTQKSVRQPNHQFQCSLQKVFAQWMEYVNKAIYDEKRSSTQQGKRHQFFNFIAFCIWEHFRISSVAKVAEVAFVGADASCPFQITKIGPWNGVGTLT